MNVTRRVAKNSVALFISTAIRVGLAFAFTIYIGRTMGPDWLGKLAILLAFLNVFQILAAFGIPPLVTREVARDPSMTSRYFYGALLAQGMLGIVAAGLMAFFAWVLRYPADTTAMLFAATLSVPLFAIAAASGAILQAHERMEFIAIIEAIHSAIQWLVLITIPLAQWGVVALSGIKVGGMAVMMVCYLVFLLRLKVVGRPIFDFRFAWQLARRSSDLLLLALFGSILFRMDVLVLSKVLDEAAVGIYNAAQQLVKMVALMATAYTNAIYPTLSRLFQDRPRFFMAAIRKSLQYGEMLMLPLAVGTAFLAQQLIVLIYGPVGYGDSVFVLQLLAWYMPMQFAYVILSQALIASDQQNRARQVAFVMVSASFIYQLLLTRLMGAPGAAVAGVLSYLTGAILTRRYVAQSIGWFRSRVVFGKPVLATLGMALLLWPFRQQPLFVVVPLAVVVYLGLLLALRTFAPEDLALVRRLLSRSDGAATTLPDATQPVNPPGTRQG